MIDTFAGTTLTVPVNAQRATNATKSAKIMLEEVYTIDITQERLILVVPKNIMISLFPENHEKMAEAYMHGVDVNTFKNCPYLMESSETLLSLAYNEMGITVYQKCL